MGATDRAAGKSTTQATKAPTRSAAILVVVVLMAGAVLAPVALVKSAFSLRSLAGSQYHPGLMSLSWNGDYSARILGDYCLDRNNRYDHIVYRRLQGRSIQIIFEKDVRAIGLAGDTILCGRCEWTRHSKLPPDEGPWSWWIVNTKSGRIDGPLDQCDFAATCQSRGIRTKLYDIKEVDRRLGKIVPD